MLAGKVLIFVIVTVLLATALPSKQPSGVGSGRRWPSFAESNRPGEQELKQKSPSHSVGTQGYQVSPKEAAVTGPNKPSEFVGNLTKPIDNKWYPKPPNKIRFHFNSIPQERSQDVSKKMLSSFSQILFKTSKQLQIPQKALNTLFFQEMGQGILLQSAYGSYMVQDTVYLGHTVKMYQQGAQKMSQQGNEIFAQFYEKRAIRFAKDHQQSLESWPIKGDACVKTGQAVQMYMEFQQDVVNNNPGYLPIATLPCSMLWSWIAGELINKVDKENIYRQWIETNARGLCQQGTTEVFVDGNYAKLTKEDEKLAFYIFCKGIMMEVNFFREVRGQNLEPDIDGFCAKLLSQITFPLL